MLKFENIAEVGDTIKAYDFEPMEGRPDYFLVGTVTAKGNGAYTITVTESPEHTVREGIEMFVPFEVMFDEWDGRVSKVA